MALWTPTQLGADVVGWWDAQDSSTLVKSGTSLTAWNDKSRSGITASGAATYTSASTVTGKPTVTFNGSQELDLSGVGYLPQGTSDATAFSVASSAQSGNGQVFSFGYGNASFGCLYLFRDGNNNDAVSFGLAGSGANVDTGVPYSSLARIAGAQVKNSTSTIAVNADGGDWVLNPTGQPINLTFGSGAIGRWPAYGASWVGDISEIVIVDRVLTSSTTSPYGEQQMMEGYLAWKWGIQSQLPANHPYANAAPTVSGGTSTGTLTAAGASGATFIGAAYPRATFTAFGGSNAAFYGTAPSSTTLTSVGTSTFTPVGASKVASSFTASGAAALAATGSATAASTLTAAGAGNASFVYQAPVTVTTFGMTGGAFTSFIGATFVSPPRVPFAPQGPTIYTPIPQVDPAAQNYAGKGGGWGYLDRQPYGICDRCGFTYRLRELRKEEWSGLMSCKDDFTPPPVEMSPPNVGPEGLPYPNNRPDSGGVLGPNLTTRDDL